MKYKIIVEEVEETETSYRNGKDIYMQIVDRIDLPKIIEAVIEGNKELLFLKTEEIGMP